MRKSKITSVSLSEKTWKHTAELMKAEGSTRSQVVTEAIETYYRMKKFEALQAYGAKMAKKLGIKTEDDVDRLVHEYRRETR